MRRHERDDTERINDAWNARSRDGAPSGAANGTGIGKASAAHGADEFTLAITRLETRDDAPHVDHAFADRLLTKLVAQHPGTLTSADQRTFRDRSSTVNRIFPHRLTRTPARRTRDAGPKVRRSGPFDLVAVAAVVLLILTALMGDRASSLFPRSRTEPSFQLAASTPTAGSGDGEPDTVMHRGEAARTGVMPGSGPNGAPTLAWTSEIGDGGGELLIAANGRAFFTAYSEQTGTLDLAAADLKTGDELWRAPIDVDLFSVPAVADGIVYVGASQGLKVIGVDVQTGDVTWTYQFSAPVSFLSPVVHEGIVYVVGPDASINALDARDAKHLWGVSAPGGVSTEGISPGSTNIAIADGKIFGRGNGGIVFALDIRNREIVWTAPVGGSAEEQFLVSDGVLAVTAIEVSERNRPKPVRLHALDAETGEAKWEPVVLTSPSTLAAADGVLFVADSLESTGTVGAYDIQTGDPRWTSESGGNLQSPVYVDGQLYVLSAGDGSIRRLDASTGTVNWSVYLGAYGDPLVADGMVLASGAGTLYAVAGDEKQGTSSPTDEPVDLSGLPPCEPPRNAPKLPLTGDPAETIDVESRPVDDSGASGPPTTIDGRPVETTDWRFILTEQVPVGDPATSEQVERVEATIAAMGDCARRPGSTSEIAGFFSDDFFRRGIVTPGSGNPLVWSIQPDEEQLKSLEVVVLEDGRIAASTVNEWGAGTFLIFVEEGGRLLIDEAYLVSSEYPVSA